MDTAASFIVLQDYRFPIGNKGFARSLLDGHARQA
jgi:hypothetical protein